MTCLPRHHWGKLSEGRRVAQEVERFRQRTLLHFLPFTDIQ
jgi:hypothetical protein